MDGLLDQRPLSYFVHASDQAGGLALLCAAAADSRNMEDGGASTMESGV